MIKGVHTMFYSTDADATRAFIRDKLGFPHCDVGGGWLIFQCPEADMGVHPTQGEPGNGAPGEHSVSFYCDDIKKTVSELKKKGVAFTSEIEDHGFGLVATFEMPGGIKSMLYEPRYVKKF